MPAVACPLPDCDYITGDLDAAIVAALITAHSTTHAPGAHGQSARTEKVKRPEVCAAGPSGSGNILSTFKNVHFGFQWISFYQESVS